VAKLYQSNYKKQPHMTQAPQPFIGGHGTPLPLQFEAHWYVAYVVARHEKVVARHLALRSVESFLPLYHAVRYWKNRRAHAELPLFPNYLFVRISAAERMRVLEVASVVHIVTSQGVPVAVPDEEIAGLRAALQLRQSEPCPYLAAGRRIRIIAGPLQGLEGVVVRQNSRTRIIVSVDFIRRSTAIELRAEDLECLPDTARML
jgi:transcription antitermination factor NusG